MTRPGRVSVPPFRVRTLGLVQTFKSISLLFANVKTRLISCFLVSERSNFSYAIGLVQRSWTGIQKTGLGILMYFNGLPVYSNKSNESNAKTRGLGRALSKLPLTHSQITPFLIGTTPSN